MKEYEVTLNIDADEYLRVYSGQAKDVIAGDATGRRIQFPAAALRPFVTRNGIRGCFIIRVDTASKLIDVQRKPC